MATCLGDADGFFMEFWGIEAHSPGHRLAVVESGTRGHQRIAMLGRNLDEKTEHRIVPDFQRSNPRCIPIAGFHLGNRLSPIAPC